MLKEMKVGARNPTAAGTRLAGYAGEKRLETSPNLAGSSTTHSWDRQLARVMSNVGSPPILASVTVMLTAAKISGQTAWIWGGVYVLIGVLIPFLYVV